MAKRHWKAKLSLLAIMLPLPNLAYAQADKIGTLENITKRGKLICGVERNLPGFSAPNPSGRYEGIDVDVCRAVAAAVLGDAEKIQLSFVGMQNRFTALQTGEIDILVHDTTYGFTRTTQMGLASAAINFYTGTTFIVRKADALQEMKQLDGATVCNVQGTQNEQVVSDFAKANGITIKMINFADQAQAAVALEAGRCNGYVGGQSDLAAMKLQLAKPADYEVFSNVIDFTAYGPMTRQGDEKFTNIVRWSVNTMIHAEELGITSKNVDEIRSAGASPATSQFLGKGGNFGKILGLRDDFTYQIIKQVGNYGEAFDRSWGEGSPFKSKRGLNALWSQGGLMWSPSWF